MQDNQTAPRRMGDTLSIRINKRTTYHGTTKVTLLKDIALDIGPGNMVLILGGSGAGKTTFVNAVTGYEKAQATVCLGGTDVYKNYDRIKYSIGFVPQSDLLRGDDTVAATLLNAAQMRLPMDISEPEKRVRVRETLERFGLSEFADSHVSKLSGGQRKRLSIGVEYISDPSLFILDEPDSGLDGVMARDLMQRLRTIADQGKIVMVITHQPDRAIDLFDQVLVLAKDCTSGAGRLAFYGPVGECRNFFGVETMEQVIRAVNAKTEGGLGEADTYIARYQAFAEKRKTAEDADVFRLAGAMTTQAEEALKAAHEAPENGAEAGSEKGAAGMTPAESQTAESQAAAGTAEQSQSADEQTARGAEPNPPAANEETASNKSNSEKGVQKENEQKEHEQKENAGAPQTFRARMQQKRARKEEERQRRIIESLEQQEDYEHVSRVQQTEIYLGKLFRLFMYERHWKVLVMSAVIALLVSYVVGLNMFKSMEGAKIGALAFACVCIWNGFFNSIQMVCKERDILKREHRAGLHITAYMAAQVIYQAIICELQVLIFAGIFRLKGLVYPEGSLIFETTETDIVVTLFLITFSADMLALMVSCIVRTTETAMSIVPFLLMLQMLFSDVAFPLHGKAARLADITVAKWGIRCICSLARFNTLPSNSAWNQLQKLGNQSEDGRLLLQLLRDNNMVDQIKYESAQSMQSALYAAEPLNILLCWGVLIGFAALYIAIGTIALEFVDRDKR